MKRIGIFMDVSNLYYTTINKFNGRKLDYGAYHKYIEDLGEIVMAKAYGAQQGNEAHNFIKSLNASGFETNFKQPKSYSTKNGTRRKADWDVGISVEVIESLDDLDLVVLGSADGDFAPLVDYINRQGKKVIVTACGISKELANIALETIEIPESLLEEK